MKPATPPLATRRVWWWFLVPLLTLGWFTFAMVLAAGVMLRHRLTQVFAAGYLALALAVCGIFAIADPDADTAASAIGTVLLAILWLGGTGHVLALQFLAGNRPAQPVGDPDDDAAVQAARWRLERRREARELMRSNPALANELQIGRPDLPHRTYDDGGLVDVNHVPAPVLAAQLEIPAEAARQIAEERTRLGGFTDANELLVFCAGLSEDRLNLIRDRLCFLPM